MTVSVAGVCDELMSNSVLMEPAFDKSLNFLITDTESVDFRLPPSFQNKLISSFFFYCHNRMYCPAVLYFWHKAVTAGGHCIGDVML